MKGKKANQLLPFLPPSQDRLDQGKNDELKRKRRTFPQHICLPQLLHGKQPPTLPSYQTDHPKRSVSDDLQPLKLLHAHPRPSLSQPGRLLVPELLPGGTTLRLGRKGGIKGAFEREATAFSGEVGVLVRGPGFEEAVVEGFCQGRKGRR
jgi:hypothetical protein